MRIHRRGQPRIMHLDSRDPLLNYKSAPLAVNGFIVLEHNQAVFNLADI